MKPAEGKVEIAVEVDNPGCMGIEALWCVTLASRSNLTPLACPVAVLLGIVHGSVAAKDANSKIMPAIAPLKQSGCEYPQSQTHILPKLPVRAMVLAPVSFGKRP